MQGGKFNNNAYKVSGGLHGVGVSVVNALSEYLIATVKRDGKEYTQKFERGISVSELEIVGNTRTTGTTIEFMPDREIFDEVVFSFETLEYRLREMAFLNRGIKILLEDKRKDIKKEFH